MPLKNWKNEQSRKSSISRAYPSPKPVVSTIRRAVGHRAKPAVLDQDWSLLSHRISSRLAGFSSWCLLLVRRIPSSGRPVRAPMDTAEVEKLGTSTQFSAAIRNGRFTSIPDIQTYLRLTPKGRLFRRWLRRRGQAEWLAQARKPTPRR